MRPPAAALLLSISALLALSSPGAPQAQTGQTRRAAGTATAIQELNSTGIAAPPLGHVGWWRGDREAPVDVGSLVASWGDEDGVPLLQTDGRHMPRLDTVATNGNPALVFDGNDFLTQSSGMPTASYTKIVVLHLDAIPEPPEGSDELHVPLLSGLDGGHELALGPHGTLRMAHDGVVFASGPAPLKAYRRTVLIATYDAGSQFGALWVDRVPVASGSAPTQQDKTLRLGSPCGFDPFVGTIAEVMLYDRALGAEERLRTFEYFQRYAGRPAPDVDFAVLPGDGQLFPRVGPMWGSLRIEGKVNSPDYTAIEVVLTREGTTVQTASQLLTYGMLPANAPFAFDLPIAAGLFDHSLTVRLVNPAGRRIVAQREALTCGDVLVVQGQSNAAAGDYLEQGLAEVERNHWVRSFGAGGRSSVCEIEGDLHWSIGDTVAWDSHATIGAWAGRLGNNLVNELGVPIAILNGGFGGSTITEHLRKDLDAENLGTIYGRLLFRLRRAQVEEHARLLVWYQGEDDATTTTDYFDNFDDMLGDWMEDLSSLEHVYSVQVREGCGDSSPGVREEQRLLGRIHPEVTVMSSTAISGHDGCHFNYPGYAEMGERITRLVLRDFYDGPDPGQLEPPNVQSVKRLLPDSIQLTFDDNDVELVWQAGVEAYFTFDDPTVQVISAVVSGPRIDLQLNAPNTASLVSYIGHSGEGPWITNSLGVGALTFFDVPIR